MNRPPGENGGQARGRRPEGRQGGRAAAQAQARWPGRLRRGAAALPRGDLGGGAGPGRPAADRDLRRTAGPGAIAGFGSAKCSNEEAYLFQKLIRTGFHTNNVDHCTRLCHASSVAALFEGIGSGAVSTTYGDVVNADVAIVTGSNPTANHPVASSFFKQARRNGTTIIYVDPRADKMSDHADIFCQIKPGTDVAFYNGVMHEVIRLGLTDPTSSSAGPATTRRWRRPSRTTRRSGPQQITGVHRRTHPAGGAGLGRGAAPGSSSGAWGSPSTPPAPTTPAASSPCARSPATWASRAPGCTRCAGRTTCRAPRTWA